MKLPLSWLLEYIELNITPEQIAKLLTSAGLEVDAMEIVTMTFSGVMVVRVTDVQKHPNADKLCIATVNDGSKAYEVVCGAPNCRVGIKTAYAPLGATLRDDEGRTFNITAATIRGVDSSGMLCSAAELHLSEESNAIMEFAESVDEGIAVADLYSDTIFEISLTPNLGHCASTIGVARELSALTGSPLITPADVVEETLSDPIDKAVKVAIKDKEKCPRYACRLIRNVIVGSSPDWMQKRLIACGTRPINNVVDAVNYVTLEMGHPLHAFDYDQIHGHKVIVKTAADGEKFVTLDGKERILQKEDLLICDEKRAVALAGVMGGSNSEVTDTTSQVLLEAAYFHPGTIRKTSKRLGLQTDASKRFERGTDPNGMLEVLDRAAMLIATVTGGQVAGGLIDVLPAPIPEKIIDCRLSRINSILGTKLGLSEVENVFHRLAFSYKWDGQDILKVKVPSFRSDITAEIDLIEEVARIYGYDNIDKTSSSYTTSDLPQAPIFLFERDVRSRLLAEGLQEFLTCDLIGPTLLGIVKDPLVPEEDMVRVLNPTSIEQSVLRTSLLPGLLQVVKYNIDHQNHDISGFEIGRAHFKEGENFKEQSVAGIILSGQSQPHHWDKKPQESDFFELKGVVENLLSGLQIENIVFKKSEYPTFHTGRQASIYVNSLDVGSIGEVHPAILRRLDVTQRIYFAELDLHDLIKVRQGVQLMKPLAIYPGSERDWTVTLAEEVPISEMLQLIHEAAAAGMHSFLEEVSLIAIYRSDAIGKGRKNATFHFVYRDLAKTIEQEEVEREHLRIITEVAKAL